MVVTSKPAAAVPRRRAVGPAPAPTRRARRPPVADTWPGHPTTIEGLRAAMAALAPDAAILAAALIEWRDTLPRKGLKATHIRRLVDVLVANLRAVPRILALVAPFDSLPADPTTAAAILVPAGEGEATQWWNTRTETAVDPLTVTGQPPAGTAEVKWWPRPSAAAAPFLRLYETPVALVDLSACEFNVNSAGRVWWCVPPTTLHQLMGYLTTRDLFWRNTRAFNAAHDAMADGRAGIRAQRKELITTADRYRTIAKWLDTLAPRIIGAWATSIHTVRQLISAVAEKEGFPMPVSLATSSVITDLAAAIHQKITEGTGGRLNVPAGDTAFAWTAGLAPTLLQYVTAAPPAGPHVPTVQVKATGTVTVTPPKGTKPTVATFTSDSLDLGKYAAIVSLTTEAAQFTANIESALVQVMGSQIIRGIEADLAAAMVADGGVPVAAADLPAGILQAIAQVPAANVLALSPADFVTLFGATGQSGYLNFSRPEDGPGTYLGLVPVIVGSLTEGTVLVADGRGVMVWELSGAPLVAVDCASGLRTNEINVAIETWAGPQVTSPGSVGVITVTAVP